MLRLPRFYASFACIHHLCYHHHHQDTELFHHHGGPCANLPHAHPPLGPPNSPGAATPDNYWLSPSPQLCHVGNVTETKPYSTEPVETGYVSLGIMSLRSTQVAACIKSSFLSIAELQSTVMVGHTCFNHSPPEGQLILILTFGWLQRSVYNLAITNKAAVSVCIHIFAWTQAFSSPE